MEANKFYSIAESTKGQVLYILSEWNAHSLSPAADSAICQFTIYTSNMLFNSDSVTSENINSSLCTPNFYYKLREYFRNIDKNIRYEFCVSDEEDEAILVVSLPLDIASNTYLRILEVRLHRIFKQNSHLDFMNRLKYYANFKETQQDQATERVSTLASIQNVVEETKLAVEKLRQEAGLQLAAKVNCI